MIRRCPTLLTMLAVALAFGLGFQPALTQADGIANYTLTTTDALAAPSGPPPGTPSVTLNSTLKSGSTTANVPSTTGLGVGYQVSGTGMPSGTTIGQISSDGSQVTLEPERNGERCGKPGFHADHCTTASCCTSLTRLGASSRLRRRRR